MKKPSVFKIVLFIIVIILFASFLFKLIYFDHIHKNVRPVSEQEKQRAIDILNKSVNLEGYQINVFSDYLPKTNNIVMVELTQGNLKKHYFIDLEKSRILRK